MTTPALSERQQVLQGVTDLIFERPANGVMKVGIDGVDGAGKTVFADELAPLLRARGRNIIRASVDSFHNPRTIRYRLGRDSPDGYFVDSFNYTGLKEVLLDPLSGGSGCYRTAIFDYRLDLPVSVPQQQALPGSILIFDGLFLHRPELRAYWDFSIFLDVEFQVSIPRCAQRDGSSPDPGAAANRRYVEGQRLYLKACEPRRHATITINNNNLAAPRITGYAGRG
jgi:uridine kinase